METNSGIHIIRRYTAEPDLGRQAEALLALLKASNTTSKTGKTQQEAAVIAAASKDRNQGHVSGQAYRGDQR